MVLDVFLGLVSQGNYLGLFIVSFISSSSILIPILPVPSYLPVIVAITIGMNPLLVWIIAGMGSALGDTIGYLVGMGSSATIEKFEKRTPRFLKRFERFYSNIGFWAVLLFAFLPLPFDIVGILSGASKYDFKRFLLALLIGRIGRTVIITYSTTLAGHFISDLFS